MYGLTMPFIDDMESSMSVKSSICCLLLLLSSNLYALDNQTTVQLGMYLSDITYTEPDVMQEEGSLTGFIARYNSHKQGDFSALELHYATGYMDYEGSGKMTDIPDTMFEIRGLLGSDTNVELGYQVTTYIGLGYRYLNDDSSGMLSNTLASGYEREQTYLYVPLGLQIAQRPVPKKWYFSARLEYDFFLFGKNTSHLGDIPGYDDVSLNQNDGYGYRASIAFNKEITLGAAITIEPFYRYWNVSDSNVTYDSMGRGWIEPYNYSKEFGISLIITSTPPN